jgi:hypothetical protein
LSLASIFCTQRTPALTTDSQDDETMLTASAVRQRYGNVSQMWLERQLKRSELGFPKPLYIGARRLWRLGALRAWEQTLPSDPPAALLSAATKGVEAKAEKAARRAQPQAAEAKVHVEVVSAAQEAQPAAARPPAQKRTRRPRPPRESPRPQ